MTPNCALTKDQLLPFLACVYELGVGATKTPPQDASLNQAVVNALNFSYSERDILDFLNGHPFIFDKIKSRSATRPFFAQHASLLAYVAAGTFPAQTKAWWPLEDDDLAMVFSDLGQSFE